MGRPPCCDKSMVKKGLWTADEDAKLLAYVSTHGTGNWTSVPKKAGLKRCGKSCRLRWTNYLRPNLKHEGFTPEEEEKIVALHATIGSRWSIIAKQLPGRTDNDIKNYWNTKLSKQLYQNGIDPITHRPVSLVMQSLRDLQTHTAPVAGGSRCYTPRNLNTVLLLPGLPPPTNLLSSQHQLSRPPFAATLDDGGPPNPVCFPPSEPSCCSTAATAPRPPSPEFNWTDLLAESILSDDNSGVDTCSSAVNNAESAQGGRVGLAGEGCGASSLDDEGTSHGGGASCAGSSSFVDAMLEQDRKLFSKFCEFLGDM